MAVAVLLELFQPRQAVPMGGAHRGLVRLEEIAGARRAIAAIGSQRQGTAAPFDRVEQEDGEGKVAKFHGGSRIIR